jgi:hypothetical protein
VAGLIGPCDANTIAKDEPVATTEIAMNLKYTRPERNPPKHPQAPTDFIADSDTTLGYAEAGSSADPAVLSIDDKRRPSRLAICMMLGSAALAACNGDDYNGSAADPAPPNTILTLASNVELTSTVAPNGDLNPYFITTPPSSFTGINSTTGAKTVLQPGDLLISDFSSAAGGNNGTSIMRYTPATGQISLFYQEHIGSGPVGGAISGMGTLWIANFQPGYTNSADGATTGDGNIVVTNADGGDFPEGAGIIDDRSGVTFDPQANAFSGPWGQVLAVKAGTNTPFFFTTNTDAGAGTIQRQEFKPGNFSTETVVTIGEAPTGTNAFDPTGPQGMAYDAVNDILYVTDAASNQILAFMNATTSGSVSQGIVVYEGQPLNAPIGLTFNPLNGDLITVNQLDNNMVEIDPNLNGSAGNQSPGVGTVVGVRTLDPTPVDANAGTGSALFGVLATKNAEGNLIVYYTNSNSNSLNVLK